MVQIKSLKIYIKHILTERLTLDLQFTPFKVSFYTPNNFRLRSRKAKYKTKRRLFG